MDSVREIALAFCAAAVFTSAFGLLNGRILEKSGRYIIALILICTIVGTVANGKFAFVFPKNETKKTDGSDTVLAMCEYQAKYFIKDIFKKRGIVFENINVIATKSEDGSIIINEIEVKGAEKQSQAQQALAAEGIDCRVIFS